MRDDTTNSTGEEALVRRSILETEKMTCSSSNVRVECVPISRVPPSLLMYQCRGGSSSLRRSAVVMACLLLISVLGTSILNILGAFKDQPLRMSHLRYLNSGQRPVLSYDPQLSLTGTSMTASGNGYDTAQGQEALCWRGRAAKYERASSSNTNSSSLSSPFANFFLLGRTVLLPNCSSQQLQLRPPIQLQRGEILRTGEEYDFTINVSTDLSLLLENTEETLWASNDPGESVVANVKVVLCDVHKSGFCTPFVHERQIMMGQPEPSEDGDLHGDTHMDSSETYLTLEKYASARNPLALQANNITVSMTVNHPGEYFAIAAVKMYSQEGSPPTHHRWDLANAIVDNDGGRLLHFQDPPIIVEVSSTVELVSYAAIGLASFVVAALLLATIYYRNSQILQLTQGTFLIAYLICALVAISSSFLLNPKNDAYCLYSFPILLISLQVMYAITAGRLWRIHAILSPILKHRDTDNTNDNTDRRGGRRNDNNGKAWNRLSRSCLPWLGRLPCARFVDSAKCQPAQGGLKRTIPNRHLSFVIGLCALPQIVLQIASLTRQPQERAIHYTDDGSMGRAHCDVAQGSEGKVNLLIVSFVIFVVFLFLLLAVAYYSRKLPSVGVLNETRQIYDTTLLSMILLVLAVGVVLLTENARTSPDVAYIVWVTVVVWTTLNSAIRIMFPKLKLAYNGETVIVSALVKEHHRKHRAKEEAKLKELTAKAHAFQKCVLPLVKDREHNAEFVRKCFVGEEAIDALVEKKVVASRWEGTQLGRLLERELGLFLPVGGNVQQEVGFQDDVALYRFQEYTEAANSSLMPRFSTMQHLQSSMTAATGRPAEDEVEHSVELLSRAQLMELAEGFKSYVDLRHRKYHLRTYQSCFVGSEAVDSMMYAGLAKSREDAVKLGRAFQSKLKLFRHVSGAHDFKDEYLFFRYQPIRAPEVSETEASNGGEMSENEGSLRLEAVESGVSNTMSLTVANQPMMDSYSRRGEKLTEEAKRFVNLVTVKNRRYHLSTYKRVFIGAEAVDAIVYSGMTVTRWEAVQLGRSLAKNLSLFKHVTGHHAFSDDFLFYRYSNENVPKDMLWDEAAALNSEGSQGSISSGSTERSQLAEKVEAFSRCVDVRDRRYHGVKYRSCFVAADVIDSLVFTGVVKSRQEAVKLGRDLSRELRLFRHVTGDHVFSDDYLFFRFRAELQTTSSFNGSEGTSLDKEKRRTELLTKAKAFRACTEVRNRKYRMRTYKNCFIGMDTVDMMVSLGLALTRKDAVLLGRQLARELNLFGHVVCDANEFCDEYLFFRFGEDEENNQEEIDRSCSLDTLANYDVWMVDDGVLETVEEMDSGKFSLNEPLSQTSSENLHDSLKQLEEFKELSANLKSSARRLLHMNGAFDANQKASARRMLDITEEFAIN